MKAVLPTLKNQIGNTDITAFHKQFQLFMLFQNTSGPFGELDLSRPDNINQQTPTKLQRVAKLKPKQKIVFDGHMDLSRPDNINQQNPILNARARSVLAKRSDSLGIIIAQHNNYSGFQFLWKGDFTQWDTDNFISHFHQIYKKH